MSKMGKRCFRLERSRRDGNRTCHENGNKQNPKAADETGHEGTLTGLRGKGQPRCHAGAQISVMSRRPHGEANRQVARQAAIGSRRGKIARLGARLHQIVGLFNSLPTQKPSVSQVISPTPKVRAANIAASSGGTCPAKASTSGAPTT